MKHWSPASEYISDAVDALQRGRLIGLPTETVYGLAGNALDPHVVAEIFQAKRRPHFDPLIVHVASLDDARKLSPQFPKAAETLAERFWPGPLTLVLPRAPDLPDLLSAGLETIAVRMPAHPIATEVIQKAGFPLAAPSANRFGSISPTQASHVLQELDGEDRVAGVLDAGPCQLGLESTVVGFPEENRAVIYRLGGLEVEELRSVLGRVDVVRAFDAVDDPSLSKRGEQSPGMLARHYAPRTPLLLLDADEDIPAAYVDHTKTFLSLKTLSQTENLVEAAANLFGALRRLDEGPGDVIIARRMPDEGIGQAMNDRLYRAAEK